MWDILQTPTVRVILGLTILGVVVAGAVWLMRRLRDRSSEDRCDPGRLLGNFEEMKRQGDISADEFRLIQSAMGGGRGLTSERSE